MSDGINYCVHAEVVVRGPMTVMDMKNKEAHVTRSVRLASDINGGTFCKR